MQRCTESDTKPLNAESTAVNGLSIVALKVAERYIINASRKTLATGN